MGNKRDLSKPSTHLAVFVRRRRCMLQIAMSVTVTGLVFVISKCEGLQDSITNVLFV